MHSFPLRNKKVQEYYLLAGEKYHISFPQIHLYTLGHQCYYRSRLDSLEGQICLESIKQGVLAANEMGIPTVIIDGMRLNNAAKKRRFFQVAQYAVAVGEEYGIQISMETDMTMEDQICFLDKLQGKIKLCFDAHNPVMYGTGYPPDMIRTLGKDRIDHLHVKESQANEDGFLSVETPIVLLGDGCTFFRESAQAVKDIGFCGWIVSENFYFRENILSEGYDYVSAAREDVKRLLDTYGNLP